MSPNYCNRTATGLVQNRTEQECGGIENPENPLDKQDSRQSRTHQETRDLTYKEGVAGSNPASPTQKSSYLQVKSGEQTKIPYCMRRLCAATALMTS
jgi:hypothetical protein